MGEKHKEVRQKIFGVPLTKVLPSDEDESILVRGYFTSDQKDEVGDIITRSATERAIVKYRRWGNVRYMHLPKPVGRINRIGADDGLEWNEVEIKVIDPQAVFEVKNDLLTALSVGIYVDWESIEILEDGGWLINDYGLSEISLVDHPANYDAMLTGVVHTMTRTLGQDVVAQKLDHLKEGLTLTEKDKVVEDALEEVSGAELIEDVEEEFVEKDIEVEEPEEQLEKDLDEEIDEEIEEELEDVLEKDIQEVIEEGLEDVEDVEESDLEKTTIPYKETAKADKEEAWSKPSLGDFTDSSWGDLSSAERKRIASHYTWSANYPPETFGDLKLPHHKASTNGTGAVVWRGVAAAMSRLNQANTNIPSGDRASCYNHLAKHYKQFDEEPPEKAYEAEEEKETPAVEEELEVEEVILDNTELDVELAITGIEDDVTQTDGTTGVTVIEELVEPDTSEETKLIELEQKIEELSKTLKTLTEALLGREEQDTGEDVMAELEQLRQRNAELEEENKALLEELDTLRLPANRRGKIQETVLPEEVELEEEDSDEELAEEPILRSAVRKFVQAKFS